MTFNPFHEATKAIYELLEMYKIDTNDPDVEQNITNVSVVIDNAYNGYDSEGIKHSIEPMKGK